MSITERIRYGAAELKASYNRNLAAAFAIALLVHAGAIGLYLTTSKPAVATTESERINSPGPTIIELQEGEKVLDKIDEPPSNARPEPRSGPSAGGTGATPKNVAGATPIITDQPGVDEDFPTVDQLGYAGQKGAEDGDLDGGPKGPIDDLNGQRSDNAGGVIVPADTVLDATADFLPDVSLPVVDESRLMANTKYPEIATRNGIEGTVQIRALIGLDGRPEKIEVLSSDHSFLEAAAVDAVKATVFEPGQMNKQPVRVWIQFPMRFRLD